MLHEDVGLRWSEVSQRLKRRAFASPRPGEKTRSDAPLQPPTSATPAEAATAEALPRRSLAEAASMAFSAVTAGLFWQNGSEDLAPTVVVNDATGSAEATNLVPDTETAEPQPVRFVKPLEEDLTQEMRKRCDEAPPEHEVCTPPVAQTKMDEVETEVTSARGLFHWQPMSENSDFNSHSSESKSYPLQDRHRPAPMRPVPNAHAQNERATGLAAKHGPRNLEEHIAFASQRLLSGQLTWKTEDSFADYRNLRAGEYFNHFQQNAALTTKAGLTKSLKDYSTSFSDAESFFPRCPASGHTDFILDFRRSAALRVALLHRRMRKDQQQGLNVAYQCNETVLAASQRVLQRWQKDLDREHLDEGDEGAHLSEDLWEALLLYSDLQQSELLYGVADRNRHAKNARSEESCAPTIPPLESVEEFLSHHWGYGEFADTLQHTLMRLEMLFPQWSLLGNETGGRNVWIVKPGTNSKSNGIECMSHLKELLQHCDRMPNRLVQKYGLSGVCLTPRWLAGPTKGTITSDFEMLKSHLLEILQAHEGLRVTSPRSNGKAKEEVLLPRAALKVLDAAEEYRKGVEYFNRVVEVVEKMDNYEMMVSGRVLQEILVQAGLAEAHHRLRTFKASVSQEVQETKNAEDSSVVSFKGTFQKLLEKGLTPLEIREAWRSLDGRCFEA
eukprot:g10807.t1